jgi:hypothetical protein
MTHKLPKIKPFLILTFKKPTAGFWNGGVKSVGTFRPKPSSDGKIKWGSFGMNFWFRTGFGHSWKHAASIAKNKLHRLCSVGCSVKVVWE